MANEFDIFNISVSDLDTGEKNTQSSDLYSPKPDQGQDGTYRALIRFLPNLKNPRKPYVRKFTYWLEDREGNGMYVDSPSTIGEKCPIQDAFFKLRNSESALDKKMAESLKRRETYYALVQIVKDPQNRDLEGQIKVFKFGYKIKTKIDEELNPQFDEPTQIFDPFEGKNFELVISKKAGYANYDSCKFQGSKSSMTLNGSQVSNTDAGRKEILEYLQKSPDLSNFDYKSWSDEQRTKVMNVLSQYTSPGESISKITKSEKDSMKPKKKVEESKTKHEENDDFSYDSSSSGSNSTSYTEDNDSLDDFINGLDL
jgi:hypothetical protein